MKSFTAKCLFIIIICCVSVFNSNAQYTKLLNFNGALKGSNPQGSLISDGTFLYGMTYNGGANDLGTIFKIKADGSAYAKLLDFDGTTNGGNPFGSLIFDGTYLYGMTYNGGANDSGTIFKIMPDGSTYTKLLDFSGSVNGSNPRGSLISDGTFLYGMTYSGGSHDSGVVFKIKPDGTSYSKLLDFSGSANGSNPRGSLISDGTFLYGMTYKGGANDSGTIFKIKPDGTNYSKLLDFSGSTNGSYYPLGSLISDGTFLYGMTYQGGMNDLGTIFKIMPDGTGYFTLLDFSGAADGSYPFGSLIFDGTFLFGMTYQGGTNDLGTIFTIKPDGTGYSMLLDCSGAANGSYPLGSLISDGTFLYGMTSGGGTSDLGTIFNYQLPAVITTVTAGSFTVCAGSNSTVSYNVGGVFNAGNDFIVQLSDASGSFSAPVNIGSLNSNASGTIPCIIPSNTAAGTGYRVRVVSTAPVIVSNDNGTDITINTTPSIATTTPDSRCDAGTVTLGATASAGTLDWYASSSGGVSLGTGTSFTTPSISSTTPYYVSATENGCTSVRTAVTATVIVVTATTPASRCDIGTVTLGATASAGTLNWYASSSGGVSLGTGINFTTPSLTVTTTYYVDATNACTSSRVAVVATVNPLPVITTSGNTTICTGGSTILTASGGTTYSWSEGGQTSTSITVSPTIHTTYTVIVSDTNGCSDTSTVTVTIDPCTGISAVDMQRSVVVYPNPSMGMFNVECLMANGNTSIIYVYNMQGEKVFTSTLKHSTSTIHLDFPAGIYYYRVNDEKSMIDAGKIVVE